MERGHEGSSVTREPELRICHHDIGRGAYLKPETFENAMRLAAESGFTHFLPYLENMIRLPSMAKACPACAYTPERWRAFDAVAHDVGLELMPHFNVVGHSLQICAVYPELAGRSAEKELDITLKTTQDWTVRCLEEFCAFSQGKCFLIGGDEWQTPNHLLAQPGFSVAKAWASQVNLACDVLSARGRVPVVWHDMLVHYPEALDLLSRKAVVAFWFYDEDADYPVLDMLRARGIRTIMASGMIHGLVSRRARRAITCAAAAARRYCSEGIMVTCWEDARWEKQSANMPVVGALLRDEPVPEALLEAAALYECLLKLPAVTHFAGRCRARLVALLKDPAWQRFPDCHAFLCSLQDPTSQKELVSYLRYHADDGPLIASIRRRPQVEPPPVADAPQEVIVAAPPDRFGLDVDEKSAAGPVLRFFNAGETLAVYPRYGGTLQDWRRGPITLIPHALPAFLQRPTFEPGGYRSYTGAGGFRPIWALGTHHNPCILWQGAFDWRVAVDTGDLKVIELSRLLPHVDVCYRVAVRRGTPGFVFDAEATNRLEDAYGAFNFNLPLDMRPQDLDHTDFEWKDAERLQRLTLHEQGESFFRLPPTSELSICRVDHRVRIGSDPERSTGFYVDWGSGFLTPDLRGVYRKLGVGERVTAHWTFRASTESR